MDAPDYAALRPAIRRLDPRPHPAVALATAGLPLLGVFLLDWSVAAMIGLYWAENAVIGLFHLGKIRAAQGRSDDPAMVRALEANPDLTPDQRQAQLDTTHRIQHFSMPGVFVVHYGLFCLGHAAVIAFVFDGAFAQLGSALGLVALGLFAVQQADELRRVRKDAGIRALPRGVVMFQPYARVVALHLALLLAALPALFGAHLAAALIIAAIKLGADLTGVFSLSALLERAIEKRAAARA